MFSGFREWAVGSVCIPLLDVKHGSLAQLGHYTSSYLCVLEISTDISSPVLVQLLLKHSLNTNNYACTQNSVTKKTCLNTTQRLNMAIFIFPNRNDGCRA